MKKRIADVLSILLVFILVYAAASKIIAFESFATQVKQSPLLARLGSVVPWLVLFIEVLIAVLLTIEATRLFALYCCFSLMVMFTTYIFIIINFMDNIPCSCGGIIEKLNWNQHLVFNLVLILLNVLSVYWYRRTQMLVD